MNKCILMVLADYADEHGYCYPGQRRLMAECELSERSLRDHLASMEADGLFERQRRFNEYGGQRASDGYLLPLAANPAGRAANRQPGVPPTGNELPGNRKGNHQVTKQLLDAELTFADAKAAYPKRDGGQNWVGAEKAWNAHLKARRHTAEEMFEGTLRYADYCEARGKVGTEWVLQASTFFGPSARFTEPWDYKATPPPARRPSEAAPPPDEDDEPWMRKVVVPGS